MNVKVSAIMQLPIFDTISLIAGHKGLEKTVSQIAVMEVPDFHIGKYEPGLFLLSTLYCFKDDPALMVQAFSVMADQGISGILLKLDRFIAEAPSEIIQIAEEKQIPLFVAGKDIKFRNVIFSVISKICNSHVPSYSDDSLQDNLFNTALSEQSIPDVLKFIGDEFNSSCCCLLPTAKILTHYTADSEETVDVFPELVEQIKNIQTSTGKTGVFYTLSTGGTLLPCVADKQILGFLWIKTVLPLNERDRLFLKQMTLFLSFGLLKQFLSFEKMHNTRSSVIDDLVFRPEHSGQSTRERLHLLGFHVSDQYCIAFIKTYASDEKKNLLIQSVLNEFIEQILKGSLLHTLPDGIILIASFANCHPSQKLKALKNLIKKIALSISIICHADIGISGIQTDFGTLSKAYMAARQMIRYGNVFAPNQHEYFYDDFLEIRTIAHVLNTEEHFYIRNNIIAPILEYDSHYSSDLWKSLEQCLAYDTLTDAAAVLNIHLSTLRYRIKKIHEICGRNCLIASDRYILRVAYILSRLPLDC